MAKNFGNMRPGRQDKSEFDKLVSPLGSNGAENPTYSPSRPVTGAQPQPGQQNGPGPAREASQTEYARNQRRGG